MTEHSQETKIAILEAKVEHMMGHVKELTQRVRANEKVVASVSLLGVIACTIIGAGYFAPKAEACSPPLDGSEFTCPPHDGVVDDVFKKSSFEDNISEEEPRYINDWEQGKIVFYDTREDKPLVIMDTYNHMVDKLRNWKAEQNRTPVEDMINASLEEYSEHTNEEE